MLHWKESPSKYLTVTILSCLWLKFEAGEERAPAKGVDNVGSLPKPKIQTEALSSFAMFLNSAKRC